MAVSLHVDTDFLTAARAAVDRGQSLVLSIRGEDAVEEFEGDDARTLLDALTNPPVDAASQLPAILTTGQAADLLGVSRPTVVKLVDDGVLPAERVGTHRRLRTEDVLAHRARAAQTRAAALDEITRLSEDLGLYE
jgi:excisionase family DNA binding protein